MNGQTKITGTSIQKGSNIWQGQVISYYATGVKKDIGTYSSGWPSGTMLQYYPNGKLYCVKEFFSESLPQTGNNIGPNHRLYYLVRTCNDSTGKATLQNSNGHFISYTEDFKKIFEQGDVKNGEREGVWTGRVDNKDSVTFTEQYTHGNLIEGKSFKNGQTFAYLQREVTPQFTGGEAAFYRFLSSNILYPSNAKRNNIQGRVFVSFVVERDGNLTDIKVLRTPSDDLGFETVRVLNMSPEWVPGKQYGIPVRVQYTVPVNFSLGASY